MTPPQSTVPDSPLFFCCGRGTMLKCKRPPQMGIRRINDPLHARGYPEICPNAEMRKLLHKKMVTQSCKCAICKVIFTDYTDIVPDHINPCVVGGAAWRDDHPENIRAVHWWCNGNRVRVECNLWSECRLANSLVVEAPEAEKSDLYHVKTKKLPTTVSRINSCGPRLDPPQKPVVWMN